MIQGSGLRIAIIGGTSAIARACARIWCRNGAASLVLVGRDAVRLEEVAADLRVRSPRAGVEVMALADMQDPGGIRDCVSAIAAGGAIDLALVAHGSLPDQAACQQDLEACRDALAVNAVSPALFAEALVGQMERAGRGTLALIGSVAGDRGRGSNYAYGAAKGLVTRYAQGLQHRLAGSAVKVVLVKPGPTDTPMTAMLKAGGARLAPVDEVAASIVDAMGRGQAVVYAPGKWKWIMGVIRHLPTFVFNRMRI